MGYLFLVLGFANGIAQGFGVMVSHCYGAKDYKLLKHYVALSIILTIIVSAILTSITMVASRQLLLWMNTPENIFELANDYMTLRENYGSRTGEKFQEELDRIAENIINQLREELSDKTTREVQNIIDEYK